MSSLPVVSQLGRSRRAVLSLLALGGLSALASCAGRPVPPPPGVGRDETDTVLGFVNQLRKDKGLTPLSRDPAAVAAARYQAARMAKAGKMAHLLSISDSFHDRMKDGNVKLPAAENIAAGQASAEAAYQAWFHSPKHLENMLGSHYSGLGVAVVANPATGNRPYWAMVLSSG
ncbi:secretion protein [Xaviernesmea oryzae]|uniref:Secretion protein n=1 Tax=Xaviernesmea oryzae TaxID=464029 RepID=A0A1Q9ASB2_9HYPH|nr:CAP domain-containing protein [Xaviernesmea oryzae]OLP58271.1 secretion protein [Xaviernesmea oryzae]SEL44085.1 Uncharacterized conserved protein YkwD, contains CAP (CSP/antigen 5/PR1) domain [Xaviernesmea oryzae]